MYDIGGTQRMYDIGGIQRMYDIGGIRPTDILVGGI
jgi:hypothetical protein